MKKKYFTKSAFKQALFCPASLYYYYDDEKYANQNNEDDFLQALADGGNQVGDLAKVYYDIQPDADIKETGYAAPLKRTKELFKLEDVNIAEAAFKWKNCFVRADIIEKKGNQINLIEVKAKSWDKWEGDVKDFFGGRNPYLNTITTDIREYVYDVAFQKYVIEKALEEEYGSTFTVTAYLMMADKTIISNAPNGINQFFRIVKEVNEDGKETVGIKREEGAEKLNDYVHVLRVVSVDRVCQRIYSGNTDEQAGLLGNRSFAVFVEEMSRLYVDHKLGNVAVSDSCFKCPFVSNEKTIGKSDGKRKCWIDVLHYTEEQYRKPSVGELWCGLMGPRPFKKELVRDGKVFLSDVSEVDIPVSNRTKSGLLPSDRRVLQIAMSTKNDTMLEPFRKNIYDGVYLDIDGLRTEMKEKRWRFPYHMIDFETTAVALPFYDKMRPYEPVAFQFSHHIIDQDGRIEHYDQYINTEKHYFPNFDFIKELKSNLEKDGGTIFRYANHENTILRAIRKQLDESDEPQKEELIAFIDTITHPTKKERIRVDHTIERDMVDLLDIIQRFYYHPAMKGSNSIKAVLPAILNSSETLKKKYCEPIYGSIIKSCNYTPETAKAWITLDKEGKVENPYKHLDVIASFLGVDADDLERFDTALSREGDISNEDSIANGGAALAAYTKLQFSNERLTPALKTALLRYCELDTMSMVFIMEYFIEMMKMHKK